MVIKLQLFKAKEVKNMQETTCTSSPYLLEMINISKSFPGVKALDCVTLQVREGSVHALMGENGAGKSTLMKCLFGIYQKEEGEIRLKGQPVSFNSSKQALDHGISMVHQELNQVRTTRIMDNIWLGRFPMKGMFVDEKKMYEETLKIFNELDIQLDPRLPISNLTVSHAQMVEIAKAVSYDSKIIVMDEPTSSLTEKEVQHLFKIINSLKARGLGIIYISHKMEEIEQISDDITIMRDGQWVATEKVADLTTEKIINLMVGRDLSHRFPPKTNKIGSSLLKVESLTAAVSNSIQDINFELYEGEILGVAGLVGAKRTELIETIFGARKHSHGTISLKGELIENKTPHDGINHGFALVTEERRLTGIFDTLDITANATIANLNQYSRFGFLNQRKMIEDVNWVIDKMSVKTYQGLCV